MAITQTLKLKKRGHISLNGGMPATNNIGTGKVIYMETPTSYC